MKKSRNLVYLGISLDGYIADKDHGLEWLDMVPNPDGEDMGYYAFLDQVDALLMGRTTFQKVLSFGIDWPYKKQVFVWSSTLKSVPKELEGKVEILSGSAEEMVQQMNDKGFYSIYVDGGKAVQSFLNANLIHEITLSRLPIILGDGIALFDNLKSSSKLELISSEVVLSQIVQSHYRVLS